MLLIQILPLDAQLPTEVFPLPQRANMGTDDIAKMTSPS